MVKRYTFPPPFFFFLSLILTIPTHIPLLLQSLYRRHSSQSDGPAFPISNSTTANSTDYLLSLPADPSSSSSPFTRVFSNLGRDASGARSISPCMNLSSSGQRLPGPPHRSAASASGTSASAYPPNIIRNQKYSLFTFLPIVLYEQVSPPFSSSSLLPSLLS